MDNLIQLLIALCKKFKDGTFYINDVDVDKLALLIKRIISSDTEFSKYSACNYLGISRASFDNYIKEGKVPKGEHKQGFKELFWYKKDLDEFKKL